MKRIWFVLLAGLTALLAPACGRPAGPVSGPAEIPLEILGELDESSLRELVDEPKYVALTFDDGPRADTTERLLDGLLERGAVATFFVIGQQIQGNEALLQRMEAEGHQIGNHTYSHIRLQTAEKDTVVEEIHKTEVMLREVVGEDVFWLRPPYGAIDEQRASLVRTPMIYWSVDPQDWKLLDAGKVVSAVMGCVQPGDVVLLHDFYPTSVDAALAVVDQLQAQGYTLVTVEELFRIQGVTAEAGVLYASPTRTRPLG